MHSWNNVRVENGIIEQKQCFIEQTNTLCNRSINQTSYTAAEFPVSSVDTKIASMVMTTILYYKLLLGGTLFLP
jgi:hypothetical protein